MACRAPRKVGSSARMTSPGSTSALMSRSKPCVPPCTGKKLARSGVEAASERNSPALSMKGPKPSVAPYCKSVVPYFASTSTASSEMTSGSKAALEGLPPAKEIMPGLPSSLKISRMAEPVMGRMWAANASSVNFMDEPPYQTKSPSQRKATDRGTTSVCRMERRRRLGALSRARAVPGYWRFARAAPKGIRGGAFTFLHRPKALLIRQSPATWLLHRVIIIEHTTAARTCQASIAVFLAIFASDQLAQDGYFGKEPRRQRAEQQRAQKARGRVFQPVRARHEGRMIPWITRACVT